MDDLELLRRYTQILIDTAQDMRELVVKLDKRECEECSGEGIAKIPADCPDPICPACGGEGRV